MATSSLPRSTRPEVHHSLAPPGGGALRRPPRICCCSPARRPPTPACLLVCRAAGRTQDAAAPLPELDAARDHVDVTVAALEPPIPRLMTAIPRLMTAIPRLMTATPRLMTIRRSRAAPVTYRLIPFHTVTYR